MLQVFHIDVAKVDLVLHMLQWDPLAAAAAAAGAPLWVTVRTPEAGRPIRDAHPQAGQVTGTHMMFPRAGAGTQWSGEAKRA